MNLVQKALSASFLGAALLFSGAAFADHNEKELTTDEANTVSLVHAFEDCVNGKLGALPQDEINADIQKVAQDFIDSLIEEGIQPTQEIVLSYVQQYVNQMYILPAQQECIIDLDLDYQNLSTNVQKLVTDHGVEVLNRPAP